MYAYSNFLLDFFVLILVAFYERPGSGKLGAVSRVGDEFILPAHEHLADAHGCAGFGWRRETGGNAHSPRQLEVERGVNLGEFLNKAKSVGVR